MLGAFVNGEVRGVATSSNEVDGRFMVLMSVYSNQASGEVVSFKIYNADTDTEVDAVTTITFQDDAVNGSPSNPMEIYTNNLPEGMMLSNKIVNDNSPADQSVGTLSVSDVDASEVYTFSLVAGAGDGDNGSFYFTGDELFNAQPIDYETQDKIALNPYKRAHTYEIRVRGESGGGCSIDSSFVITVMDVSGFPTQIYTSSTSIYENEAVGTLVARLTAEDEDANETFTYSLVAGTGDTDNGSFTIKGDSLLSAATFNYEVQQDYAIRLRVLDAASNAYEQAFTISVLDTNEAPNAFDFSVSVEEDAELGTLITTVGAYDEDQSQTLSYEIIETEVEDLFEIGLTTGEVLLARNQLDYETKSDYSLTIRIYDDGAPVLADTILLAIEVKDAVEEGVLPSVDYISPNGDGKNDTWRILNVEIYENYKLMIFNANGLEVYNIESGYNNDWGGVYDGKTLPTGTYYYVFMNNEDSSEVFKGTISLVR